MKVKEVMTPNPKAIWITGSLAEAAIDMWENDCGVLPIIKDHQVVGMITDRDICMATVLKGQHPSNISVEEVMNGLVYSAELEDEVEDALKTMAEHKIRRLPVLNADGELAGMLSMNDVILKSKSKGGKKPEPLYGEVLKTLQAICEHPSAKAQAASTT